MSAPTSSVGVVSALLAFESFDPPQALSDPATSSASTPVRIALDRRSPRVVGMRWWIINITCSRLRGHTQLLMLVAVAAVSDIDRRAYAKARRSP